MSGIHFDQCPEHQIPFVQLSERSTLLWHPSRGGNSAMVAHRDGVPVAIATYVTHQPDKSLEVLVLWTRPCERKRGLAKILFDLLVVTEKPRTVSAEAATRRGSRFFARAREEYPRIHFDVLKTWGSV